MLSAGRDASPVGLVMESEGESQAWKMRIRLGDFLSGRLTSWQMFLSLVIAKKADTLLLLLMFPVVRLFDSVDLSSGTTTCWSLLFAFPSGHKEEPPGNSCRIRFLGIKI